MTTKLQPVYCYRCGHPTGALSESAESHSLCVNCSATEGIATPSTRPTPDYTAMQQEQRELAEQRAREAAERGEWVCPREGCNSLEVHATCQISEYRRVTMERHDRGDGIDGWYGVIGPIDDSDTHDTEISCSGCGQYVDLEEWEYGY